ncbi:MAG TPA: Npt1/Npt2 family nucleotide transporter [Chlamydiales bacterium]|nr:Npt1/Npt2 family nucleotide transporter [Chlamydiales bacterium]
MRYFLCFAMAFIISFEYGITRPASASIFLTFFSAKSLPLAWIATVPLNLFVIHCYNKYLPKWGSLKVLFAFVMMISLINFVVSSKVYDYPVLSFLHFIWKDIYILLMFKQFWSMVHMIMPIQSAKYSYGIISGFGGLGSMFGGIIPGFFASPIGSNNLFLFTAPLYFSFFILYFLMIRISKNSDTELLYAKKETKQGYSLKEGFRTVFSSSVLLFIFLTVVFMQFLVGLMDYQINHYLQSSFTSTDFRTEYLGRLVSIIHVFTTLMQFFLGSLLIHFLGEKKAHFFIPTVLIINGAIMLFHPTLKAVSYAFVAMKSMDFSLLNILKEMLYIPLTKEEKFRSKAVIDVFAHRTAKSLAALLIFALSFVFENQLILVLQGFSFLILFSWIYVVKIRNQNKLVGFVDN